MNQNDKNASREKVIEYLKKLQLSEIEADIYISLLESGPTTVRELAESVGIKRTTTYTYVSQLSDKGLVTEVIKGFHKRIAANKPESLQYLIEKRFESAVTLQKTLPNVLNTIGTIIPHIDNSAETIIKYFKGINGVRALYDEALKGKEIRSFVKVEEKATLSSDNPAFFHKALKKNKKLKFWEIIYDSPYSRRQAFKILSQNTSYNYKLMPPDMKWSLTSEDIVIYDGKVAIINYSDTVNSVVLQNPVFYHNLKEIFDFIWRILPEQC